MSVATARLYLAALAASLALQACCDDAPKACDDCEDAAGYAVTLKAPATTPMALFSGWRDGACWQDFLCYGQTRAGLGDVRWNDSCSAQSLAVFAPGRAPRLVPGTLPFVAQELPAPVVVPLSVWIVSTSDDFDRIRDDIAAPDAEHAKAIFHDLNTGVRLVFSVESDFVRVDPGSLDDLVESSGSNFKCWAAADFAGSLFAVNGAPAYRSGRINVYYVDVLGGVAQGGLSCYNVPGVVFLPYGEVWNPEYLAHEIGHSLGLTKPCKFDGEPSHFDGFTDPTHNLMYAGSNEVRNISLGQIYRIHFDADGWIRQMAAGTDKPWSQYCAPTSAAASILSGRCQDDAYTRYPCPPYTLPVPGGWR